MNAVSITWMVVAMVTVWGGLIAATVNLMRHPDAEEPDEIAPEL